MATNKLPSTYILIVLNCYDDNIEKVNKNWNSFHRINYNYYKVILHFAILTFSIIFT